MKGKLGRIAKMAADNVLEGVFAINKPFGMSSYQVIRDCQSVFNPSALFKPLLDRDRAQRDKESKYQKRRRSKVKQELNVKMGHGGTLDPLATGVLILGIGRGTKSLHDFLGCTKTYETIVLFGASTDTYDRTGRLIKKGRYEDVTRDAVESALATFRGRIRQVPPLYSALKMEGKPLYEYAREGKPIPREIETREVDVLELELVEWYEPGTHNHRWPTEEAEQAEKNLVDSVWRVAKRQEASAAAAAAAATTTTTEASEEGTPGRLTPAQQQEKEEERALAEYNTKKREADERVDGLVTDSGAGEEEAPAAKKRKTNAEGAAEPLMSGALGQLPPAQRPQGKGSNLVPPPPAPDAPPPWEGRGPPAAKIRMTVSSGFYVRSLCHDLGEKLGCGGLMAELVRTRQNNFSLGGPRCMEYDDLFKGEEVWGPQVRRMLELWNGSKASAAQDGPSKEKSPAREKSPAKEKSPAAEATTAASE
ncbi:hypothetical protein VTJ83DRAFT_3541 [Remersonia thermophila]|uniref:tRNA pseudouridine(55) synthase n=1 Tax=Remersonia thermophila TaxID=72144 RepID=A0ABR4DEW1_9PEZI